ncbi:unnamed protein product [Paramecium sonneborni]|uniref:Uncharacterized protein n=1 Tax=Paramecium sonneborni TaxID=65129 RepID=A0A8S1N2M5_9CILI|nr:unnamed protein product [Paramecium sonneborni]
MPKQKKSAKTEQKQDQKETQIKYIKSSKIEEIEKKCSQYKTIYEQIQDLGFPVNSASDQVINEIKEKNDQVLLGKYLASHFWGKQSDLLTKVNEQLVKHGFQVTDDLQCEQIFTININQDNIGNKYDYLKLFQIKDTACPSQLLQMDHYSSEIITKFVESIDSPELQQLQTIRKHIQDLLNKLDKIRIFSNKLSNIKSQNAEDKLLKQFENLENDYYLVKNTQFNFEKQTSQKKTKTSKKKVNPNEGDNKQEFQSIIQPENQEQKNQEQNQPELNTNQEKKQQEFNQEQKQQKQRQKKQREQKDENQNKEKSSEKEQIKKEKKAKKQQVKKENITQNQVPKENQNQRKKSVDPSDNANENKQEQKKSNKKQQIIEDPKQKKLDQYFLKKNL